MKKIFPFLCVAALFASCEKEPDLDNVEDQVVTYTQYDSEADFSSFNTFYVADKIAVIGSSNKKELDANVADKVINQVTAEMVSRGYTQVQNKDDADLGLQLSYVETRHLAPVTNYGQYWWADYPGYWGPSYWGQYYGSWYYPYTNFFSYYSGSMLCDMLDLTTDEAGVRNQSIPVIWQGYSVGLVSDSQQTNTDNMVRGIKQAFEQSPYIVK